MAGGVEYNEEEYQHLLNFSKKISNAITTGIKEAIKAQAEQAKKTFQTRLLQGNVPGPELSPAWQEKKAELGLDPRKLMRHGESFDGSYFRSVIVRELGELGQFIGIKDNATGYDINKNPSGRRLSDIAEDLELRWPLWKEIYTETQVSTNSVLLKHLKIELERLSPGITSTNAK